MAYREITELFKFILFPNDTTISIKNASLDEHQREKKNNRNGRNLTNFMVIAMEINYFIFNEKLGKQTVVSEITKWLEQMQLKILALSFVRNWKCNCASVMWKKDKASSWAHFIKLEVLQIWAPSKCTQIVFLPMYRLIVLVYATTDETVLRTLKNSKPQILKRLH